MGTSLAQIIGNTTLEQCRLSGARSRPGFCFCYDPRVSRPFRLNTPTDLLITGIRKLAQQRHAQSEERAQKASQREFARQEREDKVVAEFLSWNLPGNIWRM